MAHRCRARGGPPAVIPRYQNILFAVLLVASLVMGGLLWQLRERAHQRLLAGEDSAPTQAPEVAPAEQATLLVANDADGSLLTQAHALPLPTDPGARARVCSASCSTSTPLPAPPTPSPAALLRRPGLPAPRPKSHSRSHPAPACPQGQPPQSNDAQLAVVNLTGSFAASHPSGIETETLTVSPSAAPSTPTCPASPRSASWSTASSAPPSPATPTSPAPT